MRAAKVPGRRVIDTIGTIGRAGVANLGASPAAR
jgi:hypothetical protein